MRRLTDRRLFLQGALGAAAYAGPWALSAPATAAPAGSPLTSQLLAPEVSLVSGAGGNVVTVGAPDGIVMIDGGLAARSRELLQRVQTGKRPVQALFNTHWHWDHTGSNEALGKAGVRIIAHENTKLWMQRPIIVPWENRQYPPVPAKALPTSTFYTGDVMHFGSHELRYGYLGQAHTDGDIYIHLPQSNVLVVGDVVSVGSYPVLDYATGGWVGGVLDATKQLLKLSDEKTLIVPGSGPVVTRVHLQAESDMLEVLKERIWQLMRKGMSDTDIVAAKPTAEYDDKWGDPTQFLMSCYKGLWGHVRELRGVV
jgi:glyoxylase-like metal-dependent hydrolase (beta-lactamase superfamily II)